MRFKMSLGQMSKYLMGKKVDFIFEDVKERGSGFSDNSIAETLCS